MRDTKGLQVGDLVHCTGRSDRDAGIALIRKVTPTGQITVTFTSMDGKECPLRFKPDGYEMATEGWSGRRRLITAEDFETIKMNIARRDRLRTELEKIGFMQLDTMADAIIALAAKMKDNQ